MAGTSELDEGDHSPGSGVAYGGYSVILPCLGVRRGTPAAERAGGGGAMGQQAARALQAVVTGMASDMLCAGASISVSMKTADAMPTTSPSASTTGPPELPGLMPASNWKYVIMPFGVCTRRLTLLTTPVDTDDCQPSGVPSASTASPATTADVATVNTGRSWLTCTSATSFALT